MSTMVNLGILDHLYVIYLRESMAGDPFQGVDAILGHGQWPSTVTLRSVRSNFPPTSHNLSHLIGALVLPPSTEH